jgi:ketosteroid isomerase-like protein
MFRRSVGILVLFAIGTSWTLRLSADASLADTIIALERGALDRWGRGDPGGYLELYARDVTYFDPMRESRVDGVDAMKQLLEPLRGRIKVDRYEMIAPHVDRAGDAAILTYNLVSHGRRPDGESAVVRWNSTAVYVQIDGRWKIVHSHWSFTQAKPANSPEVLAGNRVVVRLR